MKQPLVWAVSLFLALMPDWAQSAAASSSEETEGSSTVRTTVGPVSQLESKEEMNKPRKVSLAELDEMVHRSFNKLEDNQLREKMLGIYGEIQKLYSTSFGRFTMLLIIDLLSSMNEEEQGELIEGAEKLSKGINEYFIPILNTLEDVPKDERPTMVRDIEMLRLSKTSIDDVIRDLNSVRPEYQRGIVDLLLPFRERMPLDELISAFVGKIHESEALAEASASSVEAQPAM